MNPIYLDHNATTPPLPEVIAAVAECQAQTFANPSSQHRAGRQARRVLEDAREAIAEILAARLGAPPHGDRLIFTSGGSEANNLALFGLAGDPPGRLLISAIEHPSVTRAAESLKRRGFEIETLPVSPDGMVSLGRLEAGGWRLEGKQSTALDLAVPPSSSSLQPPASSLSSVMLANNETGVIQPVEAIAAALAEQGVPLHCDAAQAVGKIAVDFRQLGASTLSIAAHKFHGPRGIGALLVRGGIKLQPQIVGGFQESELRAGTEPVALAVGMKVALESWKREADQRERRMRTLRDRLEQLLLSEAALTPALSHGARGHVNIVIHGAAASRLPSTLCVSFPGVNRQALVLALDLAGVACSSGSACASGSSDPSPTLLAMGCPPDLVESAVRFSLAATTTAEEIESAAARIHQVLHDLRSRKSLRAPEPTALAAGGSA